METIESGKSESSTRFEEVCDLLPFPFNELPWHLQHLVVRRMEAADQTKTSFLSEDARVMVKKCKLKAKYFEIVIGHTIRIGIVSETNEKVVVEIFKKSSQRIEGVEVKSPIQAKIGSNWCLHKQELRPKVNYPTVEHYILHCFSIFTHENVAVVVEQRNYFFSVGRVERLIKTMNPTDNFSWTASLFAQRKLETENFNRIITMRRNIFTRGEELREILSLKSNCITLGEVSKHNSFAGLKFQDFDNLDTYGLRVFGSKWSIVYWNLFLGKWFFFLLPRLEKVYVWFDVDADTWRFRDTLIRGVLPAMISSEEIEEHTVKLIGGTNVSIIRGFVVKIKRDDGIVAEITTMTSPELGRGFAFKVLEQDE
ncbi:hypothetical protein CAEBREN_01163 [Caenorhabditis brenneri]|uniref:F-box domain-containing protein n=1 Tax=Caenorhabditis brenneri TaxID=135651 RepID=G0MI65_CAEBE|nr:hypothetical protein CAEBREN_01163 [Caenorhabditis brenneri]